MKHARQVSHASDQVVIHEELPAGVYLHFPEGQICRKLKLLIQKNAIALRKLGPIGKRKILIGPAPLLRPVAGSRWATSENESASARIVQILSVRLVIVNCSLYANLIEEETEFAGYRSLIFNRS